MTPEMLQNLRPDPQSNLALSRQLYLALYAAISRGQLPCNHILPPSRKLAKQLGVGRNTVISVYNQLCDEGLLRSAGRRGTMVDHVPINSQPPFKNSRSVNSGIELSARAAAFDCRDERPAALSPGQPDANLFPRPAWRKALLRAAQLPGTELGYRTNSVPHLREAIARYLANYRSLHITPEQIIVTASTRQSLLLAAMLYCEADDHAWVESPGYNGAVEAFRNAGLNLTPCRIDSDGLQPPTQHKTKPSIIYLTPCFHYPTGVTLAQHRREQLLTLARKYNAAIFEDDYDSEFRDDTQPRPALAADDNDVCVIHAGTFSKLMFPAIRLAWMVVPPEHATAANRCLRALGGGHNTIPQIAVAELLDNGTVARHLQRARQIYHQRRNRLETLLSNDNRFSGLPNHGGSLNMLIPLPEPVDIKNIENSLTQRGLGALPLERLQWEKTAPRLCRQLVVGLGNVDLMALPKAVERLAESIAGT